MSAYILQHSVRRTVNISLLQTSNSGSSLGPPVLAAQTGQGAGTELWYMHELYWGSSSAEFQSKAVIFPKGTLGEVSLYASVYIKHIPAAALLTDISSSTAGDKLTLPHVLHADLENRFRRYPYTETF